MSSDPLLKAAIAHWGPRFVANGVVLTDFEEVTGSYHFLQRLVQRLVGARRASRAARPRGAWQRSVSSRPANACSAPAVYYHFASFLFVHDQAQMKAAHKKQIECRQAALPHLRPPGERVEIPYQGKTLAGILRKPAGIDKPPVVVMAVGLDSTKEEGDAYEAPFLARGVATLIFEGPGQGEAQYDFPIRGDYEVPVKAVHRFRREAIRSRRQARRHVGRQPRRLLRAARGRFRQAHQGLHRAGRAIRLGRHWDNSAGI